MLSGMQDSSDHEVINLICTQDKIAAGVSNTIRLCLLKSKKQISPCPGFVGGRKFSAFAQTYFTYSNGKLGIVQGKD